ncbi:hypothetical protein EDC04DRAFT_2610405 [Pisolithus marmoratus]|nr:hypothetical protein EDC04DRAFT_2610405 [Pisolithus marmoratus]
MSLVNVLAKPPSEAPKPDLFRRMKNVEVPTPPMGLVHALAKPPSEAPKSDLFQRMKNAEPLSKAPEPNLFKRMRNIEVPTPPAALPVSQRATICQAPSPTKAASLNVPQNANHRSSLGILSAYRLSFVSHLSEVHVNQGNAADCGYRVNFGDPDQRQLGALFSYALMGNPFLFSKPFKLNGSWTKVIPGTSTHFPGQSMIPGPGMNQP